MTHGAYTLEDLADRTGFTPRQIRYYITRGLAPGAGTRGPNVRYGGETLRRLLLTARLKELEIQPTGRAPSLAEIARMLDDLDGPEADRLLDGGMELAFSAPAAPEPPRAAPAPPRKPDPWSLTDHLVMDSAYETPMVVQADPVDYASAPADLGPLADPLSRLRELLEEMLDASTSAGAEESWRRIRTPDIEIHVRAPGDPARRDRLEQAVRVLRRLLD